ncbi:MAG: hypothetical protein M1816_006321 [Peltula sp. TS41687]|nr:MAG: hypothetical protein M1816_006321 [Peltula sp. TS41687]
MPDLNTLPPSRSTSGSPSQPRAHQNPTETPSRSSSVSLAAAAVTNAGLHSQHDSRRSSISLRAAGGGVSPRAQRSSVAMSLHLNDPSVPGPGELQQSSDHRSMPPPLHTASPQTISPLLATADPHHQRTPSLGELHQQLEQEQEAQVNRLLQMIRQQQNQLRQMQLATGQVPSDSAVAGVDDSTPTSERSVFFPALGNHPQAQAPVTHPQPRSPTVAQSHQRSSFDLSRQSSRRSRTPSRAASPALRPLSGAGLGMYGDGTEQSAWALGGGRDEAAFYQAETQMLTRENQMLRMRIRELGRFHLRYKYTQTKRASLIR